MDEKSMDHNDYSPEELFAGKADHIKLAGSDLTISESLLRLVQSQKDRQLAAERRDERVTHIPPYEVDETLPALAGVGPDPTEADADDFEVTDA